MLKKILSPLLSTKNKHKLMKTQLAFKAMLVSKNLDKLAQLYGTDKNIGHFYTPHYMTHLKQFRTKKINLLEIGVGGYDNPFKGGNSLRMWKRYFPNGKIFSIDIFDKSPHNESRISIFKGSQVDHDFLDKVIPQMGELDIIIDDGSHINEHVIDTFQYLFPKLKTGGVYVIEDTQTAYWSDYGGDSLDRNNPKNMTTFFKHLTDGLNYQEFIIPNYKATFFDENIISMHFYHNLIFIYKGANNEKSNLVVNHQRKV